VGGGGRGREGKGEKGGGKRGEGGKEGKERVGYVNQRYEMCIGHVHVLYGYIICVVA